MHPYKQSLTVKVGNTSGLTYKTKIRRDISIFRRGKARQGLRNIQQGSLLSRQRQITTENIQFALETHSHIITTFTEMTTSASAINE